MHPFEIEGTTLTEECAKQGKINSLGKLQLRSGKDLIYAACLSDGSIRMYKEPFEDDGQSDVSNGRRMRQSSKVICEEFRLGSTVPGGSGGIKKA